MKHKIIKISHILFFLIAFILCEPSGRGYASMPADVLDDMYGEQVEVLNSLNEKLDYIEKKIRGFNSKGDYISFYFDPAWEAKLSQGWLRRPKEQLPKRINWMRERIVEYKKLREKAVADVKNILTELESKKEIISKGEKNILLRCEDISDNLKILEKHFNNAGFRMDEILQRLDEADTVIEGFNKRVEKKIQAYKSLAGELNKIKVDLEKINASEEPKTVSEYKLYFNEYNCFDTGKVLNRLNDYKDFIIREEYLPVNLELNSLINEVSTLERGIYALGDEIRIRLTTSFSVYLRDMKLMGVRIEDYPNFSLNEVYSESLMDGEFIALSFSFISREGSVDHFLIRTSINGKWQNVLVNNSMQKSDIPENLDSKDNGNTDVSKDYDNEGLGKTKLIEFQWVPIAGEICSISIVAVDPSGHRTNNLYKEPMTFYYLGRYKKEIANEVLSKFVDSYNNKDWKGYRSLFFDESDLADNIIKTGKTNADNTLKTNLTISSKKYNFSSAEDWAKVVFVQYFEGAIADIRNIETSILFSINRNRGKIKDIQNADRLMKAMPLADKKYLEKRKMAYITVKNGSNNLYHVNPNDITYKGFDISKKRNSSAEDEVDLVCGFNSDLGGVYSIDLGKRRLWDIKYVNTSDFEMSKFFKRRVTLNHVYAVKTKEDKFALIFVKKINNQYGPDSFIQYDYLYQSSGQNYFKY
ncbi:MAG: hypothetical protein ABII27_06470 [bacterium]